MRSKVLWLALLLPGGMAVGHCIGYTASELVGASPSVTRGHGYLGTLLNLAVPLSVAALTRSFIGGARRELPLMRVGTLAVLQISAFLAMELVEHWRVGIGLLDTMTETSTMLGVAAQVLVAWLTCLAVRMASRAGAFVATAHRRRRPSPVRVPIWRPIETRRVTSAVAVWSLSRRGPPAIVG